jgi:predicted RNase H-like nuclease
MPLVAGVDGCPGGWLCVMLDTDLGFREAVIYPSADELLELKPKPSVLAVDMPIGLPKSAKRSCDDLAKQRLGTRHMCVFYAPTRRALVAPSRIAAGLILSRGVSPFEWELYSKINNLDHYLTTEHQSWVFEVHPELCFCGMNANVPLLVPKKTPEGLRIRGELLDREFPSLRSRVLEALDKANYARKLFAIDDVHDAIAALWSARRIAENKATTLPETSERDTKGLRMAIWV